MENVGIFYPFVRPSPRLEDNFKTKLMDTGWKRVNLIYLARDKQV